MEEFLLKFSQVGRWETRKTGAFERKMVLKKQTSTEEIGKTLLVLFNNS